jgi:hypothetical protein
MVVGPLYATTNTTSFSEETRQAFRQWSDPKPFYSKDEQGKSLHPGIFRSTILIYSDWLVGEVLTINYAPTGEFNEKPSHPHPGDFNCPGFGL